MFQQAPIDTIAGSKNQGGIKTIPQLIEFNARENPDHPFCLQVEKPNVGGWEWEPVVLTITNLQFKCSILRTSKWIVQNIREVILAKRYDNGESKKGPPVALLMNSDVGLLFHLFSLMSLGVPVLLLSARLGPAAIHKLLSENSVAAVIHSPSLQQSAQNALSLFGEDELVPKLYPHLPYREFLDGDSSIADESVFIPEHYACETDRDVFILHSSGTTGLPKSLKNAHGYLVGYSTCHDFSNIDEAQGLTITTLPLYHGFGLVPVCVSMSIGKTICFPIPSTIPTGSSTIELLKLVNARSLMTVPSSLEEIYELPSTEGVDVLKNLDFVACGGGPLKPSIAESLVASGVNIANAYGITEVGPLSVLYVPRPGDDWHYFRLRKDMDVEIKPIPSEEPDAPQRCTLSILPPGWETRFEPGDEFLRNPKDPDWELRPAGRTDDVLVLSTGEKVYPGILENLLAEREDVKAAVAFGDNRTQLGLMIEPARELTSETRAAFLQSIWPAIKEASDRMDSHARISSLEAVVILKSGAKFPRSDKGAVLRRGAYHDFEKEIDRVYEHLENSTAKEGLLESSDVLSLEEGILDWIQTSLNWGDQHQDLNVGDDVFEMGMNSLQATTLRRFLLSSITKLKGAEFANIRIPRDFIYRYPSISKIAAQLSRDENLQEDSQSHEVVIQNLITKYSTAIYEGIASNRPTSDDKKVVLLTGSTGSLGGHLLSQLVKRKDVLRVICFVRPSKRNSLERQIESCKSKGIDISDIEWLKIEVLALNTAKELFGLSLSEYEKYSRMVTHILHVGWPMDFKRKVSSFEDQFKILAHMLKFASDIREAQPDTRPRFQFISSISVVANYPKLNGGRIVPEIPMRNAKSTLNFGYAEAKLVCERLIEEFKGSENGKGVDAMIVRLGQISGDESEGWWNENEHFPKLVASSQKVGGLPMLKGTTSWLPVNVASASLIELLSTSTPLQLIYHLENPVRQSWNDILLLISQNLKVSDGTNLPVIAFDEWIARVRNRGTDANPAQALLGFFESDFRSIDCGGVILGMECMKKTQESLNRIGELSDEVIEKYLESWKKRRILQ